MVLIWRNEQPIFILPWHQLVLISGVGLTGIAFFTAVYGLWHYGLTPLVGLAVTTFMLISVGFWVVFRYGRAQLKENAILYWERGLLKRKTLSSDLLQALDLGYCHPHYETAFRQRASDITTQRSNGLELPDITPRHPMSFGSLRPWMATDLDAHQSVFSDCELMRWHQMSTLSADESRARVTYAAGAHPYRTEWTYAIEANGLGIIGHFEVRLLSSVEQSVEVSFGLKSGVRRRGWMTDCLRTVLAEWYTRFGVTKFYARVKPDNVASRTLLEQCGFQRVPSDVRGLLSYGPLRRVVVYQYRGCSSPKTIQRVGSYGEA